MITYNIAPREIQEAIDKATRFMLESRKIGGAYGTAITEKHLENLYKLQMTVLSRLDSK
jgi:hypothetical protein